MTDPTKPPELLDPRRKRALYRSAHRGMQETDLLLGSFAQRHIAGLTGEQLSRFEALLDEGDNDLFNWISGKELPPPNHDHDVLNLLIQFKKSL
ncbi:MAG: succinate dehydrogenase assembly factor 2 [Rhodospirillales bacterium]|nr:succinate dehydrogenase assembly factor 2 [Rhodospirillales bacterium]